MKSTLAHTFLGFLVMVLLGSPAAQADGCVVRQRAVAVKKVVETVIVPAAVAVTVPTYGASYVGAQAGDQNAEILKALKSISDRLDKLEKGIAPAPAEAATPQLEVKPGALPPVFAARCAACHQEGNEKKGGGLVLLKKDGSAASPDARQWGLTAVRTYLGEMPPKGGAPCSDEEVGQIQEFVRQQLRK